MLSFLRSITPKPLRQLYHYILASLAAMAYGYPTRRMITIGVTGTKGKSTVVVLLAKVLEGAGHKVGYTSSIGYKIGKSEWLSDGKQTMEGRFALQKKLAEMRDAGCRFAIVETTSEGIAQYRHKGIAYDIAIFTNLTPEHIESHGSFDAYRAAKGKMFQAISHTYKPGIKKTIIANIEDENASFFLKYPADERVGYAIDKPARDYPGIRTLIGTNVRTATDHSSFTIGKTHYRMNLVGRFNVSNALAVVTAAFVLGIDERIVLRMLEKAPRIPGRMQEISEGQHFRVIVDYAHEPAGLEQVYQTIREFHPKKVIAVLGSQGGGRDKAKRPILGRLAATYADYIIVTNEDPYDEDPWEIITAVASGVAEMAQKKEGVQFWRILDREEAIRKALMLAGPGDIAIITGKGAEQSMVIRGWKKVPWNDVQVVRKILRTEFH